MINSLRTATVAAIAFSVLVSFAPGQSNPPNAAQPAYPGYPSETPAQLKPASASFDYVSREAMIPMRDGVKLHTVILVPKGARNAPILLTRTPYSAEPVDQSCRQLPPGADALRIRQRHRRDR